MDADLLFGTFYFIHWGIFYRQWNIIEGWKLHAWESRSRIFCRQFFFLSSILFHLIISVLKIMTNNAQISREYDILCIFPEFLHTPVFFFLMRITFTTRFFFPPERKPCLSFLFKSNKSEMICLRSSGTILLSGF